MRIVLDTNIVVSGLLRSQGNPAQILALALAGAVEICLSNEILLEYGEVLARPRFNFDPARTREVLSKLELDGFLVEIGDGPSLELPDPDDEPFLKAALASSDDYLVTGNLADYPIEKRRGRSVISPAEFMELWRAQISAGQSPPPNPEFS